jgi:transposase InsO family protein
MAWKMVLPMVERIKFVLAVDQGDHSIAELCRQYGISRKTGYKWIARYHTDGLQGLRERSRRPLSCPHKTTQQWEERIIQQRLKHPRWGPKKIRVILQEQGLPGPVPAASTIGGILDRAGLVKPRKSSRRRNNSLRGPLTQAQRPNQVWAVDYKGWFRLGDGQRCDPLTVSDLYSRYVLGITAVPNQGYTAARAVFERLFSHYGLPEIIRSDNGSPFASTGAGGLSRLSVWWILLGIKLELIAPGHPEQNGSHERMHLTLKQEACQPASANNRAQQRRFNKWRKEFNEQRPHEALQMKKPAQMYYRSARTYPKNLNEPSYSPSCQIRRVRSNGEIKWCGRKRFIGEALKGASVGVKRVDNERSQVYFGSILLGDLHDADSGGLRPTVYIPQSYQPGKKV